MGILIFYQESEREEARSPWRDAEADYKDGKGGEAETGEERDRNEDTATWLVTLDPSRPPSWPGINPQPSPPPASPPSPREAVPRLLLRARPSSFQPKVRAGLRPPGGGCGHQPGDRPCCTCRRRAPPAASRSWPRALECCPRKPRPGGCQQSPRQAGRGANPLSSSDQPGSPGRRPMACSRTFQKVDSILTPATASPAPSPPNRLVTKELL